MEPHLARLQRRTFDYFLSERNPANGLVKDNTRSDSHASITAVGMALSCYPVAVERGWIPRARAVTEVLQSLRFLRTSEQSEAPDATGYRGFYYHFLDMEEGRRAWRCELSTVDTAFLLAGALAAAAYFDRGVGAEAEIRETADALYRRCEWDWALDRGPDGDAPPLRHGWRPGRGFLPYRWGGYTEAALLHVLAMGSPTHPIPAACWTSVTGGYKWKTLYGIEHVYAGPLFIHQLPHVWIDFRGIRDAYMRERGIDYFENSRRATLVHREYGRRNPKGFRGYGEDAWGITASDGPGPDRRIVDGRPRTFWAYRARGVPFGPDDGTLSPWAVAASLPFAPALVRRALRHLDRCHPEMTSEYGFKCSFNPTYPADAPDGDTRAERGDGGGDREGGWVSKGYFGLDQGPVVLMLENAASGLPWRLMRGCPWVVEGLRRAGFTGGWLDRA